MKIRNFLIAIVSILWASNTDAINMYDTSGTASLPPVTPCHQYGGYCIGDTGKAGTIYANHILSFADDFSDALNIVGPQVPLAKYFPTKGYSAAARGNFTTLGYLYDTDPLTTGYNDSNRGIPVGFNNLNQSNGVLTLQARNATASEQSNMYFTSKALNGGVRPQVASAIHSEGTVGFYPGGTGSVLVEASVKFIGNKQSGWHPDFWVNSGNPMNTFGTGQFDSINACEGNSFTCNASINRITNGANTQVATGATFTNVYDNNNFHMLTFELTTTNTVVDLDGVSHNNFAFSSNFSSKPQYFLLTSHIYNNTWFGENYIQGNWNSVGANIQTNLIRVWRPNNGTAKHWVPLQRIPDLKVDYNGTGSIVIPTALSMWGDAGVTEYVQSIDYDVNEPGMGFNTIYDQLPPGVTYNSGTRTISVDFSAQDTTCIVQGCRNSGVLHMIDKAWKTDGSTFQPARFTIYRGPHQVTKGGNITVNSPSSVDIYGSCDVGQAIPPSPDGVSVPLKITSVTGLPTGMVYNIATGFATGTPTGIATVSVTCVNNVAQSVTYNLSFGTLQNETYALEQRMTNQPTSTTETAMDTAVSSLKTNNLWPNIFTFGFLGLGDSQASLLNWKGDYWNAVLIGTPTFSAYNGFTTNGTSNGVSVQFDSSTYSSINAIAASVLSNTSGQTTGGGIGFTDTTVSEIFMGLRNTSNNFTYAINDNVFSTVSNSDGSGLFTGMRSGGTTKKAFRNGAQIGATLSTASTLLNAGNFGLGATGGGGTTSFSARQWEAYDIRSGSFADADEANLNTVISSLKSGVGP